MRVLKLCLCFKGELKGFSEQILQPEYDICDARQVEHVKT